MPTETTNAIIRATGRSLCEHGYADLTMQRIAEESSVTTAAIHYHFETKEELLNAFLDDLIDRFERDVVVGVGLMELKAQAPYHETYRQRFVALDERLRSVIETAVDDGIEAGHFEASDPAAVARFVTTAINGGHVRTVALGESPTETRRVVERYLETELGWRPEATA